MINGKPQLVLGGGQMPATSSLARGGPVQSAFGQTNSRKNFEAFLNAETKGLSPVLPFKAGASAPVSHGEKAMLNAQASLPAHSKLNINKGVPDKTEATPLPPRTVSPASHNLPFGMVDTRPGAEANKLRGQKFANPGTVASPTSGASMNKVMENTATPLRTLNSMQGLEPRKGLSLVRDQDNNLDSLLSKKRTGSRKKYNSILMSGTSTQNLLKFFEKAEGGNLNPTSISSMLLAEQEAKLPEDVLASKDYQRLSPVKKKLVLNSNNTKAMAQGASKIESTLGSLAAKFESGESGIAAIGYDRVGGTSYGKYQISSRAGTMSQFIGYLNEQAPDLAQRLISSGPANTGNRHGRMPSTWRDIATAEPARFEKLQEDFIKSSHYEPALSAILDETGVPLSNMPGALQEVVFSTAVQHGPAGAARIVGNAIRSVGVERLDSENLHMADKIEQDLIRQIYNLRSRQFGSSTSRVRASVQRRLRNEMFDALAMLEHDKIEDNAIKLTPGRARSKG